MTQKGITPGQMKQIRRLGEDAIEKAIEELGLGEERAQQVISDGRTFAGEIYKAARTCIRRIAGFDPADEWQKLFGFCFNEDPLHFNSEFFPLGGDPGDEAEELAFDKAVTGSAALVILKRIGRVPASLWAQGRYINANPTAQSKHALIGIGAERDGLIPVYGWGKGQVVRLAAMNGRFAKDCCWLVQKKPKTF